MVFGIETEVPLGQPLRSSSGLSHGSSSNLELHSHGEENTTEYRIKAAEKSGSKTISLWHDVTLVHVDPATDRPTPYLNFVCEIPKFSRKKFEIATDEVGNFIKQDEKKGVLREVSIELSLVCAHSLTRYLSSNAGFIHSFTVQERRYIL